MFENSKIYEKFLSMNKILHFEKPEKILSLVNSDIVLNALDLAGCNYTVIDCKGNYIAQNNLVSKIVDNRNLKKAHLIDMKSWEDCQDVMKSGNRKIIEEKFKNKYYLSIKTPLIENDKCIGIVVLGFDITAQKQAETNEKKQRFIDSIYHEIKTPIAGLDMLSSCMMHAEKDTEKKRTLLFINKAAVRLKDYLNKILEFTAAQRSDNDFNKTISFNIKETMDSLIDMLKPVAVQKNIDITIDCPNEKIKLNKTNFERIVLNLLSNAVKFTDKGKITINVNLLKNKLKLSVQDTGVGISKKDQNMIFESFERVIPSEIEPDYNGCGLGLSIIKMLVLQMKGKISVTSQLKKGSTFTVELPT